MLRTVAILTMLAARAGAEPAPLSAQWLATAHAEELRAPHASHHHRTACVTPPENGAILEGGTDNPLVEFNKLVIENGYGGNAIVKLRDAVTNKLFVSFFVGVNQTASYASIPDGSYIVQYGFGRALNRACTGFLSTRRPARNPAIETFSAAYSDTRQVLTLKLYPVPKGNLKPQPIDEATFNAE